jgi:cell division septation protein DedD
MEPALKQRLVGAAVLIALAVIFLPMLIQGPAPESGVADVPLDAPRPPQGEFETRDLPLVAPEGATPADGALGMASTPTPANNPDAADLASAATAAPAPVATIASAPLASAGPVTSAPLRDTAATTTQPLPADAPEKPAEAFIPPTAGGDYAVNFGSFSTTAAADKVIASLRNSQLPGYVDTATVDGKTVQRVRIGPYATRAQAESARLRAAQVRSDVTAKVVVLDNAPAAAKPAPAKPVATTAKPATATATPPKPAAATPAQQTTPAASGTGFAVQLAAFSKAADANALRDKLRAAGFSAFTEAVTTDKGTLTRVRVGPVLNRAEADQLKAQVKSKIGLDGVVRPHP